MSNHAYRVSNNGVLCMPEYPTLSMAVKAAGDLVSSGVTKCAWVEKFLNGEKVESPFPYKWWPDEYPQK